MFVDKNFGMFSWNFDSLTEFSDNHEKLSVNSLLSLFYTSNVTDLRTFVSF